MRARPHSQLFLPVEGTELVGALVALGLGFAGDADELADKTSILAAGRGLDAGGDVDAPWADLRDRVGHVVGRQPAGEDHAAPDRRALGEGPVEDLSGA